MKNRLGSHLSRRTLLGFAAAIAVNPTALAGSEILSPKPAGQIPRKPNEPSPYDLVISGGRVVDPETRLDAVRNVGIKTGHVAAISEHPLIGKTYLKADGLIIAPGFIDLHAHGQQLPATWVQAFDG